MRDFLESAEDSGRDRGVKRRNENLEKTGEEMKEEVKKGRERRHKAICEGL